MAADKPDDALAVEVLLEPTNGREPSQGINDLVDRPPRFGGGVGAANVEHVKRYAKGLEVRPHVCR